MDFSTTAAGLNYRLGVVHASLRMRKWLASRAAFQRDRGVVYCLLTEQEEVNKYRRACNEPRRCAGNSVPRRPVLYRYITDFTWEFRDLLRYLYHIVRVGVRFSFYCRL